MPAAQRGYWLAALPSALRDAGRPTGPALALAILYALAIVLLLLVMIAADAPGAADRTEATPFAGSGQTVPVASWSRMCSAIRISACSAIIMLGVLALSCCRW